MKDSKELHPVIREMDISEPNPHLVESLERLLDRAKSGELQGFIGCWIFDNQTVDDSWIETPKDYHTRISSDRMVGALMRLTHKILAIRTHDEVSRFFYDGDDVD